MRTALATYHEAPTPWAPRDRGVVTQMFLGEVVGTALLVLIGDGVVAGVLLNKSKAQNSGWIVITWAWAMGVLVGVFGSLAVSAASPT